VTALGWVLKAALLDNGLLKMAPTVSSPRLGLVFKFFEAGVPVIHLLNIERLAADNQLPSSPEGLGGRFRGALDRAVAGDGAVARDLVGVGGVAGEAGGGGERR
jgi:hypothetical protein